MVYKFIRKLSTPFKEWDAYKLGIIDRNGNILKERKSLETRKEKKAFTAYDLMLLNIKKLLEKVPGGNRKLASYSAALYLIKEWNHFSDESILTESVPDEQIIESVDTTLFSLLLKQIIAPCEEDVKIKSEGLDTFFEEKFGSISEEPTNSASSGAVAGIGVGPDGEPGVHPKHAKMYKRRNKGSLRSILGEEYDIIDNRTGKVIDTFANKIFANGHYHVKMGWARVEKRDV